MTYKSNVRHVLFAAGTALAILFSGCEDDSDHVTRHDDALGGGKNTPITEGPATGTEPQGALTITPSEFEFSSTTIDPSTFKGATVQFRVTGGKLPYGKWRVSVPMLGSINTYTGLYTASGKATGDNIISITDAAGNIASVTVSHVVADAEDEE